MEDWKYVYVSMEEWMYGSMIVWKRWKYVSMEEGKYGSMYESM